MTGMPNRTARLRERRKIRISCDSSLGYTYPPMEVYEREAAEVIRRFLARRISFPQCLAALDAALAGLIPHLTSEQLPRLRVVMLANNEIVMKEIERRGPPSGACRKLCVEPNALERERVEGTNSPRSCLQRKDTGFSRAKQWSQARGNPRSGALLPRTITAKLCSGCAPVVAVMETAHLRDGHDSSVVRWLHCARLRRVLG
jgi:hypothetical protein